MFIFYIPVSCANAFFLMAMKPWVEYAIVQKNLERIYAFKGPR